MIIYCSKNNNIGSFILLAGFFLIKTMAFFVVPLYFFIPIGRSLFVNRSLQLMLIKYNPFILFLMKFCVALMFQPVPRDFYIEDLSSSYHSVTPYCIKDFFSILIQWYISGFKLFGYCAAHCVFEIELFTKLFHSCP